MLEVRNHKQDCNWSEIQLSFALGRFCLILSLRLSSATLALF